MSAATDQFTKRPPAFLGDFATIWVSGLIVRTVLFQFVTGSPVPTTSLRWFEDAGLIGLRLISTIPGTLVMAVCFTAMRAASKLRPRAARAVRVVCWAIPIGLALVSFSSWAGFYTTGQFMGAEAWSLAMASPLLLLEHVLEIEPATLIAVPAIAIGVVLINSRLCTWTNGWPAARVRALVSGVAATLLLSIGVAYAGYVASEHDSVPVAYGGAAAELPHTVYLSIGMDKSGPIARLLVDAFHAVTITTLRAARWVASGESGRRVLSAEDYAGGVRASSRPRFNVIVVLIESLRKDELVAEGGSRNVMPALDALARESTVYTDAVAPAAQSDYATTSILASQFPLRGISFRPFPQHIPYPRVLAYDVMKPFGYRTAVFSSQNEHWGGMYNFLNTGGVDHFLHAETFSGPTYAANADRGLREWMEKTGHAGKIDDSDTIGEAIAWTDSIAKSSPFFAYINLQSSHNPYLLARPFAPRFGTGHVSFPVLFDVYPADSAGAVRDLYDNSLAYADVQLGRLFDALKQNGRWNSTIVVVLGDHGEAFYEHGFGAHASELFSEVTHVPLIVHVPARRAAIDSLPASSIDVIPTVLGILRLPPHPAFQGIDLENRAMRRDRPLFSLTQTAMADEVCVEQDQWKLIYDLRHSVQRLYDLRNDPGETRDLAAQYPAQRDALMETIAAWWSRQIEYYKSVAARPEFYAPSAPVSVPLERPAKS
ncbi:MAG TPA: sulfatase-like hydrolase/transferase, partial [Gemmatimonadaceae bacterium]|nr:sulfatase-like hydrolase/transferase [Gemmatimonadaceae bacterium]